MKVAFYSHIMCDKLLVKVGFGGSVRSVGDSYGTSLVKIKGDGGWIEEGGDEKNLCGC